MNDFSECLGSEELAWRKMGLTHGSELFLVTLDSGKDHIYRMVKVK